MGESRFLTTVEVAALAGVGVSSVKRWAEKGLLVSARTAGGHRRFERAQVDLFLRDQPPVGAGVGEGGGDPLVSRWVDLLLGRRGLELDAALLEARARAGAWFVVAEHVANAMVELGRLWASGELTIATEHRVSEELARSLARVLATMPLWPEAPVCLLACVEGDEHTLGLTLAELCLREAGFAAHWLGRSAPLDETLREVATAQLALVALSASAASQDRARLAVIAAEVARACTARGIQLLLGGSGAWPAEPPAGARLTRSFRELHEALQP